MALHSTVGYIEVTGCDLATLVRAAYSPSKQQGLGVLDARGRSDLTNEDVEAILARGRGDPLCACNIDYLNGRSVKMLVFKDGDRLFIRNSWYDHSDDDLAALLEQIGLSPDRIGIARKEEADHRAACIETAVAYLQDHGGRILQNRGLKTQPSPDDVLPDDVERGLWLGRYCGLIAEEYNSDTGLTLWELSKPGTLRTLLHDKGSEGQ